jgi:hypothetical protein
MDPSMTFTESSSQVENYTLRLNTNLPPSASYQSPWFTDLHASCVCLWVQLIGDHQAKEEERAGVAGVQSATASYVKPSPRES